MSPWWVRGACCGLNIWTWEDELLSNRYILFLPSLPSLLPLRVCPSQAYCQCPTEMISCCVGSLGLWYLLPGAWLIQWSSYLDDLQNNHSQRLHRESCSWWSSLSANNYLHTCHQLHFSLIYCQLYWSTCPWWTWGWCCSAGTRGWSRGWRDGTRGKSRCWRYTYCLHGQTFFMLNLSILLGNDTTTLESLMRIQGKKWFPTSSSLYPDDLCVT